MENNPQAKSVKYALDLELYISENEQRLSSLQSDQYSPMPAPPVRNVIERVYPEIKAKIKFNWLIAVLPLVLSSASELILHFGGFLFFPALIWIPMYYFIFHKKKKKQEIERIRNSAEYQSQCAAKDQEYDRMQAEADALYQNQQNEYDSMILPSYQRELAEWTALQNQRVAKTETDLNAARTALENHYSATRIVPLQYRQISILQYIYDTISTSDFDVRYAIELYDKNEQRKLDEARLYQQQQANMLADEQNALIYEQNEITERARRDANIAAVVGTVQRHKTNKTLGKIAKR